MSLFSLLVGIVGTALIGLIAAIVVGNMLVGRIDLSKLLSGDAAASLSRFQFLVFTFVIALSYLLMTIVAADKGSGLPQVPEGVWALLGISGGSYVLGKGIQHAAETSQANAAVNAAAAAQQGAPAVAAQQADVVVQRGGNG
jgi:hypothetical protein